MKTLGVHKSGKVKKPTSVKPPAKKRRVAMINSRKLINNVISRVKLRELDENLIEKTETIVNRKPSDFTNIACHFKTDVTKVIHAIMEMAEHSHHESDESEQQRWQKLCGDMTFVDDVHGGKLLKRDKVIEARKIEMEYFWKMGVYEKVHRSEARGYKVITTRWVDTNKGVGNEYNYRSRLVGRELKIDKRNDLFAPTPLLEAMKALISFFAKSQDGREPLRFATIDIKRAYFFAPATRKMFIKLPAEDCLPGEEECGRTEAQLVWHKRRRFELGEAVHSAPKQNWVSKRKSIRMQFCAQVQKHEADVSR